MKTINKLFRLVSFVTLIILIYGCKKDKDNPESPIAVTYPATNLQLTSATLNGRVNANNHTTIVSFEYGTSTSYGVSNLATPNPLTGNFNSEVSVTIDSLTLNTSYHFRVKAENSDGTVYGSDLSFTTLGQINDIDNNIYNIVKIGTQIWLSENLKTTQLNDGVDIPIITDNSSWNALTTPAYCWYDNVETNNKTTYGALYNWYSVNTGKICPTGWHVPTNSEWIILETFLGGASIAGGKMKSTGTIEGSTGLWKSPNTGADNSSGFTALPGGYRNYDGNFYGQGGNSNAFWSSTSVDTRDAKSRSLFYNLSESGDQGFYWKSAGFSVRCVKD